MCTTEFFHILLMLLKCITLFNIAVYMHALIKSIAYMQAENGQKCQNHLSSVKIKAQKIIKNHKNVENLNHNRFYWVQHT